MQMRLWVVPLNRTLGFCSAYGGNSSCCCCDAAADAALRKRFGDIGLHLRRRRRCQVKTLRGNHSDTLMADEQQPARRSGAWQAAILPGPTCRRVDFKLRCGEPAATRGKQQPARWWCAASARLARCSGTCETTGTGNGGSGTGPTRQNG